MIRGLSILLLAGAVAGCDARGEPSAALRPQPVEIASRPVLLDADRPGLTRVGRLTYAGGAELTARGTSRFGGLSALEVDEAGGFLAVTDEGDLIEGRLALDGEGRLLGIAGAAVRALTDERGRPLQGKDEGDAEGLATLPDGGFAVSFERDHRVLAYSAPGGVPRRLADGASRFEGGSDFAENEGPEALVWTDALVVGSERGRVWRCEAAACARLTVRPPPGRGWRLTGLDVLDGQATVALWRAYDPFRGFRTAVTGPDGTVLARLQRPLVTGNFEGVAAVRRQGGWRLYLLADDGFGDTGRSLLLAFDWTV